MTSSLKVDQSVLACLGFNPFSPLKYPDSSIPYPPTIFLEDHAMSATLEKKSLDKPDEVRPFKEGKGKVAVFTLGDHTMGRAEFEPGWRWSLHVKPIAGTDSCQAAHTGIIL